MEGLIKCIGKYGGDIIKFVGDAMIVVWPRGEEESLTTIIRRAIQSGLEIQAELNNKRIMKNVSRLSVKIGIGAGKCGILHVGGVFKRAEFFAVGDALIQALASEHSCSHGGQVVVSNKCWELVKDYCDGNPIEGHETHEITGLRGIGVRATADALFLRNQFESDKIEKIQPILRCYVPASILPYLEMNLESFGAETRRVSIMFVSLGIDLSDTGTPQGLKRIQSVVKRVQECVYSMEGSLNKLVMDDKGSTMICIWGAPPVAHFDDAIRAVMCAIQLQKWLSAPELQCKCNVGISTGIVFAGVVGTSGSRREYSVIGDMVNLSARIMAFPKYNGEPMGKIYVDQRTRDDASQKIRFVYKTHASFKGKKFKLPIFEPVDPEEEMQNMDPIKMERFLMIHSNPFVLDRDFSYQFGEAAMVGRDKLKERILSDFTTNAKSLKNSCLYIIEGVPGCGKSLMAREIARAILNLDEQKKFQKWQEPRKIEVYATQLNPLSERKFMNGWRNILHAMSRTIASQQRIDRGAMLDKLISESQAKLSDKLFLIEDLFCVKLPRGYSKESQYQIPEDPLDFVKKQEFPDEIVQEISTFIIDFFKMHLGEEESGSDCSESHESDAIPSIPPVVLFFDDGSMMDKESWELLSDIQDNITKIIAYVMVSHDSDGELAFSSQEISEYYRELETRRIIVEKYVIHPISFPYYNELMKKFGAIYSKQIGEEIKLMAFDEDQEQMKNKLKELQEIYAVTSPIIGVEKVALDAIITKCEGNPLLSFQFIFSLIRAQYFENVGGILAPNETFLRSKDLEDWAYVDVPDLAQRINGKNSDNLMSKSGIKDIICLKTASVLGEIFTLRHVKNCSPLRSEGMTDLLKRMKTLESKNIIEIIDDNGVTDMTCRFLMPFYRESLYQKLLFREQKKGIHSAAAEFILNSSSRVDENMDLEVQRMITHMIISEDVSKISELSVKNKRMITIKKILNLLLKDTKIIKQGNLLKQGDGLNKTVEDRYVVITRDQLDYFHSKQEYFNHDALATIYLKNIGSIIPYERKASSEYYEFVISSSAWVKKDKTKGHREFYFIATSEEERDEWITTTELLKAIAVHRSFQNSFGAKLSIPIQYNNPVINLFDKKLSLSNAPISKYSSDLKKMPNTDKKSSTKSSIHSAGLSAQIHHDETELKDKLKVMFNYMLAHFTGHLMEHSFKPKMDKRKDLYQTPNIVEHYQVLQKIEEKYPVIQEVQHYDNFRGQRDSLLFFSGIPTDYKLMRKSISHEGGDDRKMQRFSKASIREEPCEESCSKININSKSEENKSIPRKEDSEAEENEIQGIVDQSIVDSEPEEELKKPEIKISRTNISSSIQLHSLQDKESLEDFHPPVIEVSETRGKKKKAERTLTGINSCLLQRPRGSLVSERIRSSITEFNSIQPPKKEQNILKNIISLPHNFNEGLEAKMNPHDMEGVYYSESNEVSKIAIISKVQNKEVSITQLIKNKIAVSTLKRALEIGESFEKAEVGSPHNQNLVGVKKNILDKMFNSSREAQKRENEMKYRKQMSTGNAFKKVPSIFSPKFISTPRDIKSIFSPTGHQPQI